MEEVQAERDLIGHPLAALVPLEDVLPVAPDARQRVPQIAIFHEVHRQNCVALQSEETSNGEQTCRASEQMVSSAHKSPATPHHEDI